MPSKVEVAFHMLLKQGHNVQALVQNNGAVWFDIDGSLGEEGVAEDVEMWKFILKEMLWMVDKNVVLQAIRAITNHYEHDGDYDELIRILNEMPSPAGYFKNQWDKEKEHLYELLRSFSPSTKPN